MNFIRKILLENWAIKLTAVILAFFLWLAVRGDRNVERIISVPLEIQIPRDMEITNQRPSFVEVTVRGAPANIGFGLAGPPAYTINIESAGEGTHEVPLSPGNVRFPATSGLEVVRISPPRITLVLEQTVTEEVPLVLPPPRGEPAPGFEVYKVSYWPTQIRISGPRSRVARMKQVNAAPVSVAGLNQSLRTFTNLVIEDHSVRPNPSGPVEVNVEVGVRREPRTIAGIPVLPETGILRVTPTHVSVEVLVPVTFKEKLTPENFSASVSAQEAAPSAREAKVKPEVRLVNSPDPNIVIARILPPEVVIRLAGRS
jgi:YbbR domain-containing protein